MLLSGTFTFLVNTISGFRLHYYNGLAVHLRYNVMRWHPDPSITVALSEGF